MDVPLKLAKRPIDCTAAARDSPLASSVSAINAVAVDKEVM
jgi:hypothetical protein